MCGQRCRKQINTGEAKVHTIEANVIGPTELFLVPASGPRKEGNVLFNDALNTFYFTVIWRRTYGKGQFR